MIVVPTKAEAAFDEIRSRILTGEIPPGSELNQEQLASSLGLSITPVRESLRRLESEGFILLDRGKRTLTVAPLSRKEAQELYRVRALLDPVAAELATHLMSPDEAQEVVSIAAGIRTPNPIARLTENRRFHRAIYSRCGNAVLVTILDSLWDRTDRYRFVAVIDTSHEAQADIEHDQIAQALLAGDAATVAHLMRHHVEVTLDTIEAHPLLE